LSPVIEVDEAAKVAHPQHWKILNALKTNKENEKLQLVV